MKHFINLPLSWVMRNPAWLDWFISEGICPELGMDETALAQDLAWHKHINHRLRHAGLACSVHLPFLTLSPADEDAAVRERAGTLLRQAADMAAMYGARHMIGHPGYVAVRHGYAPGEGSPVGDTPRDWWLEHSRSIWMELPERACAPLFLENIHDPSPVVLCSLLQALDVSGTGICFDAGHWHYFSKGKENGDVALWIEAFAPWLEHLHLHDNNGEEDGHLGMGDGCLPFPALAASLHEHGLTPTVTYEPHTLEAFRNTALWFRKNPLYAEIFHWLEPIWTGKPAPELL